MAIIVAGKLIIKTGLREQFVQASLPAISMARALEACYDFSVSPDPVDKNRVNIFEKWASKSSLECFRSSGEHADHLAWVESFGVMGYELDI